MANDIGQRQKLIRSYMEQYGLSYERAKKLSFEEFESRLMQEKQLAGLAEAQRREKLIAQIQEQRLQSIPELYSLSEAELQQRLIAIEQEKTGLISQIQATRQQSIPELYGLSLSELQTRAFLTQQQAQQQAQIQLQEQRPQLITAETRPSLFAQEFAPPAIQPFAVTAGPTIIDTRTFRERGIPGILPATFEFTKETGKDILRGFSLMEGEPDFAENLGIFRGRGVARADLPFIQKGKPTIPSVPALSFLTTFEMTGETRKEALTRIEREAGIREEFIRLPPGVRREKIAGETQKEIQKQFEAETIAEIQATQSAFQEKIDIGELTFEEATRRFELKQEEIITEKQPVFEKKLETEFATRIETLGEKEMKVKKEIGFTRKELGLTTGDIIAERLPLALEAGTIGALSLTAAGSVVAGGYLLGKGAATIQKGIATKEIETIAIGGVEAGLGGVFVRAALGPQRALLVTTEKEAISVPSNLLERELQRELLKDLAKQRFTFIPKTEVEPLGEGISKQAFRGLREVEKGAARELIDLELKAVPLEAGEVTIAGKGVRQFGFRTLWGEKVALPTEEFAVGTLRPAIPIETTASRVVEGGLVGTGEKAIGFQGRAFVKRLGEGFEPFRFVSAAVETDTGTLIIGAKPTRLRLGKETAFAEVGRITEDITGQRALANLARESARIEADILVPRAIRGRPTTFTFIPKTEEISLDRFFKRTIQRGRVTPSEDIFARLEKEIAISDIRKTFFPERTFFRAPLGKLPENIFGRLEQTLLPKPTTKQLDLLKTRAGFEGVLGGLQETRFARAVPRFRFLETELVSLPGVRGGIRRGVGFLFGELGVEEALAGGRQTRPPRIRLGLTPLEAQAVGLKQPTIQRLRFPPPSPPPSPPPFITPDLGLDLTFRGRPFVFGFFSLPGLGFFDFPAKRGRVKRKLKRQPSLVAVELGIRGVEIPEFERTGLAIRPLLA